MEKVILFGGGKRLNSIIELIERLNLFDVVEIWDNDVKKQGKTIRISGMDIAISLPREKVNIPVIVLPSDYYQQIRKQLIEKYGLASEQIHDWKYCLHYVRDELIDKLSSSNNEIDHLIVTDIKKNDLSILYDEYGNSLNEKVFDGLTIAYDESYGLYYTIWAGKRMYLKRSLSSERYALNYVASILGEQQENSPHFYKKYGFDELQGDVLLDCGAAEGFFTLQNIDSVSYAILAESDSEWIEALRATFKPYIDKVCIIDKYVSDVNSNETQTIDSIQNDVEKQITFIKMDIEGAEMSALRGAEKTLDNSNMRVVACAYHKSNDFNDISDFLSKKGFEVGHSKGFIFFPYGEYIVPELRRGLVFGKK